MPIVEHVPPDVTAQIFWLEIQLVGVMRGSSSTSLAST